MEAAETETRAVVLVEGTSDQVALETLAERRNQNLDAEGVVIVPMGGAQSIGRFLAHYGPAGLDVRLAGLCDAGEEAELRRALRVILPPSRSLAFSCRWATALHHTRSR